MDVRNGHQATPSHGRSHQSRVSIPRPFWSHRYGLSALHGPLQDTAGGSQKSRVALEGAEDVSWAGNRSLTVRWLTSSRRANARPAHGPWAGRERGGRPRTPRGASAARRKRAGLTVAFVKTRGPGRDEPILRS